MGTTAEKLTYLNTTKQNLKTVINTTGAGLTDESTFRSYANVLNDKILGAINGDVDLFEEYPKVSGNGTDLSLNGVVEGKMSITPQGVSSQDGEPTPTTPVPVKSVTGENSLKLSNKNLLNITTSLIANRTNQGVTTNVNNNQSVTLTGTWNNSATQKRYFTSSDNDKILFPAGTYTLSSSPLTVRLEIRKISSTSRITVDGTFTSEEDFYITNGTFILTYNQTYNTDVTIMLEKGSSATDYVPYEEQNYQLSLGNIELNSSPDGTIRDAIKGSSDVSYNLFDGARKNVYFNSQKQFASGIADALTTNYIPASEGDIFTISTELASSGIVIASFDKNKVCISRSAVGTSSLSLTYTCPANTKYIIGSNFIGMTTNTTLVKGSEAKPYFPYGQVGMWYKREYIGKVVLDSNLNSVASTNFPNLYQIYANVMNISYLIGCFCDNFKFNDDRRITDNTNANIYLSDNQCALRLGNESARDRFYIKSTKFASANELKTYFNTNPTTLYYVLATYKDIPITDTTLINQLNDIYNNAHSYNGTTNITTTYEDGNEQMYLDIEALKNVWEVTE